MDNVAARLGVFLDAVESLIAGMDFDAELFGDNFEPDHATRCLSLDTAARIGALAAGVREACRTHGRPGVSTWVEVDRVARLAAEAVKGHGQGNMKPWTRDRDRIRELLDELRLAGPQDEPAIDDQNVALRHSHASGATPVIGGDDGNKGEKGDKALMLAGKLTRNPRAILRAMMQEGATTMARSWNASELADHARLSGGQMRRAMETLRKHGLYESHRGQDGGVWLTPLGMAVAESMQ